MLLRFPPFCQENSEFWCHEKAYFLKKKFFVGKYAENERFRKLLIANYFRFLYKQRTCQSYAMRWSKLWNELVTAMLWGRQMPHVSGSKHNYERLRCHMWQFQVWKMRKLGWKRRFPIHYSFLDWTEKSTIFCKDLSAFQRMLNRAFDTDVGILKDNASRMLSKANENKWKKKEWFYFVIPKKKCNFALTKQEDYFFLIYRYDLF